MVSLKSTKKVHFEGNLCCLAFKKTIGPQKEELIRISFPDGRFQNQFSTAAAKDAE
jgi:hypothetical protein